MKKGKWDWDITFSQSLYTYGVIPLKMIKRPKNKGKLDKNGCSCFHDFINLPQFHCISYRLPRRLRHLRKCVHTANSDFFTLKVVAVYRNSYLTSQCKHLCEVESAVRGQYDEIFAVHEISVLFPKYTKSSPNVIVESSVSKLKSQSL